MRRIRAAVLTAGATALAAGVLAPLAGYGFAVVYRRRAGFPARRPPLETPADHGLPFENVTIESATGALPAWFIPADAAEPGAALRPRPGVVLVHGWESNRARMLPNARFLRAAGFHTLMFDVRGHGENPPELLPISAGEFGADTAAAVAAMSARPEVTTIGVLGHSMGAAGAAIAAARDPRVRALVLTSTPADPRRLTRRTFQLAGLPFPGPVAAPLSWITTRVYLRPRGHAPGDISARRAVERYAGPVLLVHGSADEVVPVADLAILAQAAGRRAGRPLETLVVERGFHRWLYEDPTYRARIAAFLARHLGGPLDPDAAAAAARATESTRPPDTAGPLAALERKRERSNGTAPPAPS